MSFFGLGKKKKESPSPSPGGSSGSLYDRPTYAQQQQPSYAPPADSYAQRQADPYAQRQQLFSGASQPQGMSAQGGQGGQGGEEDTVESLQAKTLQVQGETTASGNRALQQVLQIQDMGMSTLNMLDKNQQQLDRMEGRLGDAFDQAHKASIHTRDLEKLNRPFFVPAGKLKGDQIGDTTFRGSSKHGFLDESGEAKKRAADEKRRAKLAALGMDVAETRGRAGDLVSGQPAAYGGDGAFQSRSEWEQQQQNRQLDAIGAALPGIKRMAVAAGETIDSQTEQIGRMQEMTSRVTGKVDTSQRRLEKIAGSSSREDPTASLQSSAGKFMVSQAFR